MKKSKLILLLPKSQASCAGVSPTQRKITLFLPSTQRNHPPADAPASHIFQLTYKLTQVEFGKTFGLWNFISVERKQKSR